ncbi:hypothetical protein [Inquilinus limosus]|uniref:hypothetical protein n=1 Tax=Inquilinus limosus TaxID=171674 RepID=UPI00041E760C|nr:hypothetical protein [Inquilinus limosus]
MFSLFRRRDRRCRPDGAEALLAMTPRELADLPFWIEPPQSDCADDASARRPVTARTAPRRQPA